MRKLLNKPWFVTLLAIAAVAFVVQSLLPKSEPSRARRTVSTQAESETSETVLPTSTDSVPTVAGIEGIRAALKELSGIPAGRDPFAARPRTVAAVVEKAAAVPDIVETVKLSAVWVQAGETYLLINGRICRQGDRIGRLTIESATADGVWLRHWKGRDFMPMGGVFVLTTPAGQSASIALTRDS